MRNEDRGRLRVTAQVMICIAVLGLGLVPITGGDPLARNLFVAGMLVVIVTMLLLYQSSFAERDNGDFVGVGGVTLAAVNICALYYMGTFSLATMTGALGLYIFCLGGRLFWCSAVYAVLSIPHGVLALLIMSKELPDRGLISADGMQLTDQVALQCCAQAVYAIAFLAGQKSRRKLEVIFGDLERAARVIAQRDALLQEAKRDLERVHWVSGEGRFTGQVVGAFQLGNVIGRGGMGEVYEAFHRETQKPAAVKLLHRHLFHDPSNLARFAREASAVASLTSVNVVRVLETPPDDSSFPYLAMERLRGEDLASMLRREQRLSLRDLCLLAEQVASALDNARSVGVIHRDIKPQNLFLARAESGPSIWKVLDFGVSKLAESSTLTCNQIVGTPDYMAPEQAAGLSVDHRADLYALAAVLYRCVAGRAPFSGQSLAPLLNKVIHHMPPRPGSTSYVSSDVEAFLAIGLAKLPSERYSSGEELAAAFRAALDGTLPSALRERAERILERTPWSSS